MSTHFAIRPLGSGSEDAHRAWVTEQMRERWGSERIVTRGVVHETTSLPGFVAIDLADRGDQARVGWVVYRVDSPYESCEIIVLHSLLREKGVGTALVDAVVGVARHSNCADLWLITTNDNVEAIRFWQKRGFVIRAVHVSAMEHSRRLKPEIPATGRHGIPIRDEIEFSLSLSPADE